jgi:hypothetical protein
VMPACGASGSEPSCWRASATTQSHPAGRRAISARAPEGG